MQSKAMQSNAKQGSKMVAQDQAMATIFSCTRRWLKLRASTLRHLDSVSHSFGVFLLRCTAIRQGCQGSFLFPAAHPSQGPPQERSNTLGFLPASTRHNRTRFSLLELLDQTDSAQLASLSFHSSKLTNAAECSYRFSSDAPGFDHLQG